MHVASEREPDPWIRRHAAAIAAGGAVLDLACGSGRHVRLLRERGHPVCAVDRDPAAVAVRAPTDPGIEVVTADLEQGPWPLGARSFAGVVVVDYLWRPLWPRLLAAVAPGGVLLYATFQRGHEQFGRPRNPDFLLAPGELRAVLSAEFAVLDEASGPVGSPPTAVRQAIAARRAMGAQ